jgi:hypothetical protein
MVTEGEEVMSSVHGEPVHLPEEVRKRAEALVPRGVKHGLAVAPGSDEPCIHQAVEVVVHLRGFEHAGLRVGDDRRPKRRPSLASGTSGAHVLLAERDALADARPLLGRA